MVTAAPIEHPHQPTTHLIQRGVRLDANLIKRLAELRVNHAWISHPIMDDLDHILLSKIPQQRRAIYDTIKRGFGELDRRAITTQDYQHYCDVIGAMVTELLGRDGRAGDLTERLFDDDDEMAGHCANVAFLAVTIAVHLEDYIIGERRVAKTHIAKDLTSLGVGAMLHDIGKLNAPPPVKGQHETSLDLHDAYRDHVLAGWETLRHQINPVASTIALHHHQRWDGAGWPDMTALTQGRCRGAFSGHKIHIFARIVAAANTFDSLTHPCLGPRRPGLYALHALQSPEMASKFDPIVLDALLRYLPPFPTGVQVVLNNGRLAAVSAINPDQPCRPRIRYIDEHADGEDIDLTARPDLFIEESQGLAVGKWLYDLPPRIAAFRASMEDTIV